MCVLFMTVFLREDMDKFGGEQTARVMHRKHDHRADGGGGSDREGEDRFGWVSEQAILTWLPAELGREESKVSFMFLPYVNKPFTNMQSTGKETVLQWEEARILC